MASEPVTFLASFPPIQSAIKVGDSGMRLQLDVPETEMANAVELLAMRNVVLKVTVEVAQKPKEEEAAGEKPKRGLTRFSR
jgi:hypothetical protein